MIKDFVKIASLSEKFESAQGSVFFTDQKSVIMYANKALQKKKGYSLAQMVGNRPGDLWGGKMSREFYNNFWNEITIKKNPIVSQVHNLNKKGDIIVDNIFVAPIENKYFLEINPVHTKNFEKEFLDFWGDNKNNDILNIQQICKWVIPDYKEDLEFARTLYSLGESGYNFIDLIDSIFIEPTQSLFIGREKDKSLILNAQSNSEEYSLLYNKYYLSIYYYLLKRVGSEEVASDLCQETFLKCYKNIKTFRFINSSYYTFLIRVAHNTLLNYYRKKKDIFFDTNILEILHSPNTKTNNKLDYNFIWKAVERLPKNYQYIVKQKYKKGLKIKEIAKKIGKSENAVKLILSRARKKLRKLLK